MFLLLAFVFWLLIKLSGSFTSSVPIELTYVDLPANKMLQSNPQSKVEATLNAVGFSLLKHKFSNKKIEVSLKNVKRKTGTKYYLLSSQILKSVDDAFGKSIVTDISPDTLYFELGKSISKKVKVEPDVSIQYKTGYHLSGDLKITPEYITISGPKSQVDTVIYLTTKSLKLTNVYDTIASDIDLLLNNELSKLTYSATTIEINGKVEKFTEQTLEVPFTVQNVPSSSQISTFPSKVNIVFQVGLSDFNKVSEEDFQIVCDYASIANDGLDYLIPKVILKPNFVSSVKIVPNKIEFLLEK
jgi:YbbR domain-containing protein